MKKLVFLSSCLIFIFSACSTSETPNHKKSSLPAKGFWSSHDIMETGIFDRLKLIHEDIKPSGPNDWLSQHDEPGQSFMSYVRINPVRPDSKRNIIYITLLGEFDAERMKIINVSAEYISVFFGMKVVFSKPTPIEEIPDWARRTHPTWGDKQILSTYILNHILEPGLPNDAFCYIMFTSMDLWPGKGWNFVYGQASLRERIGVWSIYRNGDPSESAYQRRLCLERTMGTGSHEIGHIFSMKHCTAYECLMNGSNNRREADETPHWLCPVCLRKLCYATNIDPIQRYRKLAEICKRENLQKEAGFFLKSADMVETFIKEKK